MRRFTLAAAFLLAIPAYAFLTETNNQNYMDPNEGEVRSRTCADCNGTGLIAKYHCIWWSCYKDHDIIYCNNCGGKHCIQSKHENCYACQGTGKIVEEYDGYIWIKKF